MNKFLKLLLGVSLLATCILPVSAQNIGAEYQSGDLVFFDKDTGNYVLKLQQTLANGTPITHPTLQEAVSAAAGTAVSVVPTAANVVAAGDVVSIASDGGTDASVPVMVTVTIER